MPDQRHVLQTLLEDYGLPTRSYSGRGMYGKSCLGVEAGDRDLLKAVFEIGFELGERTGEDEAENKDRDPNYALKQEREAITKALSSMRQESLGLGVITYFPGVPFVGDSQEPDVDDDSVDDIHTFE
jgi:hypothetical protein